ncbi:MAG: hypothetical protein ACI8W8_002941 [Rhodothermales bacterium]|jgi:hypothetical protein
MRYFAFILLLLAESAIAAQPAMAWPDRIDLYLEGRITARLIKGQVVLAEVSPEERDYLRVLYQGRVLRARKRYFRTQGELRQLFDKSEVTAKVRLRAIEQDLQQVTTRLNHLREVRVQVQTDRTMQYREVLPVIVTQQFVQITNATRNPLNHNHQVGGAPQQNLQPQPQQIIVPQYSFTDRLSPSTARRIMRDLDREIGEIAATRDTLRSSQMAADDGRVANGTQMALLDARFQSFNPQADDYLREQYISVRREAVLYDIQQKKPAATVPGGNIVSARPNFRHTDRLLVSWQGKTYDSPRNHFESRADSDKRHANARNRLIRRDKILEDEIAYLLDREGVLGKYVTELNINVHVTNQADYSVYHSGLPFHARTFYQPVVRQTTLVVRRSRARETFREWRDELDAIAEALYKKRAELVANRQQVIELDNRQRELFAGQP